jgi:exopolysaccharide biosynthesis polyprenyl glycosylphosphotransferase
MHPGKRDFYLTILKIGDILSMLIALAMSLWLIRLFSGESASLWAVLQIRFKVTNFVLLLMFIPLWYLIFLSVGLYDTRRFEYGQGDFKDIVKAVILCSMVLLTGTVLFQRDRIGNDTILLFTTSACMLTWIGRTLARTVLEWMHWHGRNLCHLLLVGSNQRTYDFARRITAKPHLGYHLVGYVDDPPTGQSYHKLQGFLTHLGTFDNFDTVIDREAVDEVVVSLPIRSCYERIKRLITACEVQGIRVHLLSDFFELTVARAHPTEFDDIPILTLSSGTFAVGPFYLKRAFDLVMSVALVLLLSPLFLLIALLIKASAPGSPVFFAQTRIGYNRRHFKMLKFRTMVPDAELLQSELEALNEAQGPVFKIKNDPRITFIGHFLRRASLDELPQLFNVIKGDMSLVGPRPLPLRDVKRFEESWLKRRFSVKPGITCLWQVNGRSNTDFDQWIEQDLTYIDHWTFGMDLKILAMTIPAVLRGRGAH